MLVKFTFKNFKSFLDEQTLALDASFDDSRTGNIATVGRELLPQSAGVLRTGAIFGNTASGKTNVLKALDYMKRVVMLSSGKVQITRQNETFAFMEGAERLDSHYEVEFITGGTYYRYGFVIRSCQIVKEWLFRRTGRLTPLFSRDEYSLKIMGLAKNSARLLSPDPYTLFLTSASSLNLEISREIAAVQDWFSDLTISLAPKREDLLIYSRHPDYLKKAMDILHEADCGIDSLSLVHEGSYIDIETGHRVFSPTRDALTLKKARMFQDRELYSDGTVDLVCILAQILCALDGGKVLLVNDFTSMINVFLANRLLCLFTSDVENPHAAQLIVTGGISPLIDKAFRRDQIHFTTRDAYGQSHLVRLSSIPGVRKNESYEKRLLESTLSDRYHLEG